MKSTLETLAAELGDNLLHRGWQVTCAESCTGGGIAAAITSVAGSSRWFGAGFVTYSNEHKQQLLGVAPALLEQCGAVSSQVVRAMAQGALRTAGADRAVAVSGVAGPGGGSVEKPVGTVWVAWAVEGEAWAEHFCFAGDRTQIRDKTVVVALEGLIQRTKNTV